MSPQDANQDNLDELMAELRTRSVPGREPAHPERSRERATSIARTPDCLSTMQIAQLATGAIDPSTAASWLDHVSECAWCGTQLHEAKQDLGGELTGAESKMMTRLESATREWQTAMAGRVPSRARSFDAKRARRWPVWAAAAAIVLSAGGWWLYRSFGQRDIERLLVEAYHSGRPFEFRLDLPGYAPLRQQAGSSDARLPAPLLSADAQLQKAHPSPDDKKFLHLRAVSELLERRAAPAVDDLEKDANRDDAETALQLDLAVAYALRSESNPAGSDLGAALNRLLAVLHKDPNSPTALFDAAIVFERMNMIAEAIDYWNRYLNLKEPGPWNDEAKRHLGELDLKKKLTMPR